MVLLEPGQDVAVDFAPRPGRLFNRRRRHDFDFLEGPELPLLVGDFVGMRRAVGRRRLARRLGPGEAQLDPAGQRGDLGIAQLAVGGHLQGVAIADRLDQIAVDRLAGDRRRPRFAPFEHRGSVGQLEPSLGLFQIAMALVAALDEQRPHLAFDELERFRIGGRGSRRFIGQRRTTTDADERGD